jgi:hypothetical protein
MRRSFEITVVDLIYEATQRRQDVRKLLHIINIIDQGAGQFGSLNCQGIA